MNKIQDDATKQLQQFDEQLVNCDDIIRGLGAENETLKKSQKQGPDTSRYQSLLEKLRDYEAQIDTKNAEINYLNKLKLLTADYEVKIEKMLEEIAQLKDHNSTNNGDHMMQVEEQCAILQEENNRMRNELGRSDQQIGELEEQLNNLNDQLTNLEDENKNLKNHSVLEARKSAGASKREV